MKNVKEHLNNKYNKFKNDCTTSFNEYEKIQK